MNTYVAENWKSSDVYRVKNQHSIKCILVTFLLSRLISCSFKQDIIPWSYVGGHIQILTETGVLFLTFKKFLWKFKNVSFDYLRALSPIKEKSHAPIIALE